MQTDTLWSVTYIRLCFLISQTSSRECSEVVIYHPPVIVITEEGSDTLEQAVRTSKVNFYFVKSIVEAELTSAIEQSLQLYKSIWKILYFQGWKRS